MTERPLPGTVDQISAEIGGMKNAIENMLRIWQMQENTANQGRRALYDKFETFQTELRSELYTLAGRVDRMSDKINMIEPSVKQFNEDKLRAEGEKRLGARLWSAVLLGAGAAGWGMHELFTWIRHP
jgi:hypothetical protein